jgi:hypothetical protein
MGLLRKATFVATGGASGLVGVKANSKKERTAKALEEQNRLMKEQLRLQRELAQSAPPTAQVSQATQRPMTVKEKRAAKHASTGVSGSEMAQPEHATSPLWASSPPSVYSPTSHPVMTHTPPDGMSPSGKIVWDAVNHTEHLALERIPAEGLATTLRFESLVPMFEGIKAFGIAMPDTEALGLKVVGSDVPSLQQQVNQLAKVVTNLVGAMNLMTPAVSVLVVALCREGAVPPG